MIQPERESKGTELPAPFGGVLQRRLSDSCNGVRGESSRTGNEQHQKFEWFCAPAVMGRTRNRYTRKPLSVTPRSELSCAERDDVGTRSRTGFQHGSTRQGP